MTLVPIQARLGYKRTGTDGVQYSVWEKSKISRKRVAVPLVDLFLAEIVNEYPLDTIENINERKKNEIAN